VGLFTIFLLPQASMGGYWANAGARVKWICVCVALNRSTKPKLAKVYKGHYAPIMVIIRFADQESKRRALGYIARRFSGKSWATGEVMVPEAALASLAAESFHFTVEGPATYERLTSLRDTPATAVQ
jgi:hypothetical protein